MFQTLGQYFYCTVNLLEMQGGASQFVKMNGHPMVIVNLLPDTAWVFDQTTIIYGVEGWSQGAYRTFGKGKVVAFGEAAMFTAQLAGPNRVKAGMNNEIAPQNYQLLLNIIHWLDGKLEQ